MSSLSDRVRNSKVIALSPIKEFSSEVLFDDFEKALSGKSKRELIIFPSEPGRGKSRGVQKFLSDFRLRGFTPIDQGIVIFVSTRKEILDYISGTRLLADDYAVLDSHSPSERIMMYGGSINIDSAPILFMTTQLLHSQCTESFEQFNAAFFKGKPRRLRIWDEEFKPADIATISVDEIAQMRVSLRADFPTLAMILDDFEAALKAAVSGSEFVIPVIPDSHPPYMRGLLNLNQTTLLKDISGKIGRVSTTRSVNSMAVERRRLPIDLAPLFVLDASARVSANYEIMEEAGLNVKVLLCPPHSCENANFYFMKMGVGRSSLATRASIRDRMLAEVEVKLNENVNEPIIVIYNKVRGTDIPPLVSAVAKNPERIEYVMWGNHKASNDYRHIKKVICIGTMRLPDIGYYTNHMTCLGRIENQAADIDRMRYSHTCSSILQAFARSNMRNSVNDQCGECSIYIIDSENLMPDLLKFAFPGCKVSEWEGITTKPCKTQTRILKYLSECAKDDLTIGIKRSRIYNDLGLDRSNFAKLIKARDFQIEAARMALVVEKRCIRLDVPV